MRVCVWEPGFAAQLRLVEPDPILADDLMLGVDWALARDPRVGGNISRTDVWYIVSMDLPKRRHFVIFYAFTNEEVFFLSIIESPVVRG
jgi:hypothetical protein